MAAHRNVKFGTTYYIPALKGIVGDGTFKVQDRGSAINSRKASKGKLPVIDVFVSSKSKYREVIKKVPPVMTVYIK